MRRLPVDGMLSCNRCKATLPEDNFRRIRGGTSWGPWCRPCERAAQCGYQRKRYVPVRGRGRRGTAAEAEDLAADRARLAAWIAATDVQPRVDVWGDSSASWGAALGGL